ncbi:hypothetical protein N7493_008176 [Penicillium malachiteum]|uniref:Uncharacterized protein n=1 Tax=Penicillium malachiteum TaxID=1324776 RepID=A0AAD6HGP1_9EURO|nr:hypothetical protein N7493_008176 [Penicillium malachiteum]
MKAQHLLFFLLTTVLAEPQPEKRDVTTVATTASGFNYAGFASAINTQTHNTTESVSQTGQQQTSPTSPPAPKLLVPEVLSAVPFTIVIDLFDASARSSMASQFTNGSTPAWYANLPSDVKQYVSVVRAQISDGALTAQAASATGAAATATGTASAGSISSSSGMAAQPTVAAASMIGALGVLGLALVL